MSVDALLVSLLRHKAWADDGLIDALSTPDARLAAAAGEAALALLRHLHAVDQIFLAHMQQRAHGQQDTLGDSAQPAGTLFAAIRSTDQQLLDLAASLSQAELDEALDFRFTDGRTGRMTRAEMLAHLITHGGYHRGEIGQLLTQQRGDSPPDTFTGYLHRVERRVAA